MQGTYGLLFLCQNIASFMFTSLGFVSPTSVFMLVVWCANIIVMPNLACRTMSNATCGSGVISYSCIYSEVSLMVLQSDAQCEKTALSLN